MSTRFFTNHGDQTLLRKFQGVFESNTDIEWFDALVGFLRASGYFAIRPFLGNVPHIRILVGINVDAIMSDYHRRGLLFLADPTKALDEFRTWLRNDIHRVNRLEKKGRRRLPRCPTITGWIQTVARSFDLAGIRRPP